MDVQKLVVVVASLAGAIGLAGFLRGWNTGNPDLLQTSGPLVVASLALIGVAAGLTTWKDERHKAREAQQRESYAKLIERTFGRFAGQQFDGAGEAKLRAEVVTWGDPKVVKALAGWNRAYDSAVTSSATGVVALSSEQQKTMREGMSAMVFAVRQELNVESGASESDIERALFNQSST